MFLKKIIPHLISIAVFLAVAVIYCEPVFQGKVVDQHDIQGWKGMAQQSFEFKQKFGHMPYWTNSMFGGMPAYQIAYETPNKFPIQNIHNYILTLGLPKPASFFFLACVMMYFLLMVMQLNPLVGILGAIAYAYSTYDPIIVAVGHDTKMICIGYAPAVIGSLMLIFRKRYFEGAILTALFTSLTLSFNHFQVIYYTFIVILFLIVCFVFHSYKFKEWKHILRSGMAAMIAVVIALGVNTASIWPTNEFVKETMRGGRSELTGDTVNASNKSNGGLDKDYAFGWSYGIDETFTFLVPGIYSGGSTGNNLKPGNSRFADKLTEAGLTKENAGDYADSNVYWGPQPGTSGPVYLGAVTCFLFILGLILVKTWVKWAYLSACIFGVILAWGNHLPVINYFLFDHLPLYNKFRAPSMALVIPQLAFVVIACMGVEEIVSRKHNKAVLYKAFRFACTSALVIFLLLIIKYLSYDYIGKYDASIHQEITSLQAQRLTHGENVSPTLQLQANKFASQVMIALRADRKMLFGKDVLRSLLFVLFTAVLIELHRRNRLKPILLLTILVLIGTADLLPIGWRYLNYSNFVDSKSFESVFEPTAADIKIKADPDKYFRVFDQTADDPFSDSRASYFFNSIGGYNPAKLASYQDIIQRQLLPGNTSVFNMLNTKYYIVNNATTKEPEAKLNPSAFGNAWFIKGLRIAKDADEEMNLLNRVNLHDSAIIDKRYIDFTRIGLIVDPSSHIDLVENIHARISYRSRAASSQFAVFSEIYYPFGWNAYIDGVKTAYCRVNYLLRGLPVPAGNHLLEFRFEPRSVILGSKISTWFSLLLYVLLAVMLITVVYKNAIKQ